METWRDRRRAGRVAADRDRAARSGNSDARAFSAKWLRAPTSSTSTSGQRASRTDPLPLVHHGRPWGSENDEAAQMRAAIGSTIPRREWSDSGTKTRLLMAHDSVLPLSSIDALDRAISGFKVANGRCRPSLLLRFRSWPNDRRASTLASPSFRRCVQRPAVLPLLSADARVHPAFDAGMFSIICGDPAIRVWPGRGSRGNRIRPWSC